MDAPALYTDERGSDETFGSFADAYLKTILPGLKGRSAEADWKRDIEEVDLDDAPELLDTV